VVVATLAFVGAGRDDDPVAGVDTVPAASRASSADASSDADTGADTEAGDDLGFSLLQNGHQHETDAEVVLDADTRARLDAQLAVTREVAAQFPTVADAEAAGYRRAGPFSPGLGAHYVRQTGAALNGDGVVDDQDLREPLAIIYDGTDPGSPVAGFMYYSMSGEVPEGFVGPNDHWHFHDNVCLVNNPDGTIDAPLGADREVTEAQCTRLGGSLMYITQWMAHVWTAPGYESEMGTFSEINPALTCPDGTYHQIPIDDLVDSPLTLCRS
jgi:hypothetical protein